MLKPLADYLRPSDFDNVVGQEHILGKNKILDRIVRSGHIPNMIFYGPSGTGKTTVANIIAKKTNKSFYKLNATNASTKDIKEITEEINTLMNNKGILLYLDEIQNFNKKQQQSLLEFIENGTITLIASTTENPYFYVYNAILSRSTVFEFKPLEKRHIIKALKRGVSVAENDLFNCKIELNNEVIDYISEVSGGDLRKALNALEIAVYSTVPDENGIMVIDMQAAFECTQKKVLNYDKFGDSHYDILSAFQKSIRGSDPQAALHYLARLIKAGDLSSICRRLLVMASEDVGLAYPQAISIVKSCIDAALMVGLPEARINLAQAVLTLSTAPKSNSVITAIDAALADLEKKDVGDIPQNLKDSHYGGASSLGRGIGYKYPHDYKNNYIEQQYLPDNIIDAEYYIPGHNKFEDKIAQYLKSLKE